ncbi:MAG: hypothetical protein LBF63_05470, partial [Treponema sp.]|nr:hypothetical protein [Treponema sp.]
MKYLSDSGFFRLVFNMVTLAAVSLSLAGASVWEGAAALAPRGDLPEDGYYAATNSFPPNTVVDITNLETGRSIRVIVASGLNTPGLLAVLSPDAASRIGLGTKTIGRIRMTQPEDPVAIARFTEGLVTSGDPDYDPAAMLAVDQRVQEKAQAAETAETAETAPPVQREPVGESPRQSEIPPSSPPRTLQDPDYAEYSQNSIVSVGGVSGVSEIPPGQIADEWEEDWDERSYSVSFPGDEDSPEQTNYLIWEQGGSVGTPDTGSPVQDTLTPDTVPISPPPQEISIWDRGMEYDDSPIEQGSTAYRSGTGDTGGGGEPPAASPRDPWEEAWSESDNSSGRIVAEARSEARSPGAESSASSRLLIQQPVQTPVQPPVQLPVQSPAQEYILVPAEERPPARSPDAVPAVEEAPAQVLDRIDESLFIDSIEKIREDRSRAAEEAKLAEKQRAAEAARLAEGQRAAEAAKLAEKQRAAEAARLAEEQRATEAARLAEEQR